MALSLFSNKNRIINLILNDHSIRYVELKQRDPLTPGKWGERFLPEGVIANGYIQDGETLEHILEQCVDDWKIKGRKVRFIVPDPFVIIRKVPIPADIEDAEIRGYLYMEIGASIHLPFDEPVFDYTILSDDGENKELMLYAAQEEKVTEYAELLEEVKLKPVAADISPLANYRLYRKQVPKKEEEEQLLIAQFDVHAVNISIFEDFVPIVMHNIPLDISDGEWERKLTKEGRYELNYIGQAENLSSQFADTYKEISRLIDFYRYTITHGKKNITKILVTGDHPYIDQIEKEMGERFEQKVMSIDPGKAAPNKGDFPPRTFNLALGLALKEV